MRTKWVDTKSIARRFWLIAFLLISSLIVSNGLSPVAPVYAAGPVSLIGSSLTHQVFKITSSTHVLSNYVVPAGTDRLLVVAAATSIEFDIWEKATYGATEMTYVTAHHDSFGTGVAIWVLPLGTSATAETAANITLSHFPLAPCSQMTSSLPWLFLKMLTRVPHIHQPWWSHLYLVPVALDRG